MMVSFSSDYTKGAHPSIIKALGEINDISFTGYGTDTYTESARSKIRKACDCPDAEIHFLIGGTQTNSTVIATLLAPYEGAVATDTGHIGVHEAGAVEYTGHKVLTLPNHDGKLDKAELSDYLSAFFADENSEHMVYPGLVYISQPTELGTLYSATELKEIHEVCKKFELPLFIDGARLGYGIMSNESDTPLDYIAHNCDAFYIGGTKVGAMFGEAVVFPRGNAPKHFYTMIKQHGAMLAKGWLTALQFDTLFTDDLYFKISKNAIDKAEQLKAIIKKYALKEFFISPTNQQFVIVEDSFLAKLSELIEVGYWEKPDDSHTVIRFATSWYTSDDDIAALDSALSKLCK